MRMARERILVAQDQAAEPEAQASSRRSTQRRENAPGPALGRQRDVRRGDDVGGHGGDQLSVWVRRPAGAGTPRWCLRCRTANPMTSAVRPMATLASVRSRVVCGAPNRAGPATTPPAVRTHGSRLWGGRIRAKCIVTSVSSSNLDLATET